jgi:hypothetical protein
MDEVKDQPTSQDEETQPDQRRLIPLELPEGYVPGKYAAWYCSPEDIYGPDELGEYANAIEEMVDGFSKADISARTWEVLQAQEQRLFRRGYHFITAGKQGWGLLDGKSSPAGIMAAQNSGRMFPVNVFGARHKKIVSLLAREVPAMLTAPETDSDPMDQAASEEAEKYLKVFNHQSNMPQVMKEAAGYFYTDDRAGFLTYTVADETEWGTEIPEAPQTVYGEAESEGVSPETEMDSSPETSTMPARREITLCGGKLEWRVPIMADKESQMGAVQYAHEVSRNELKERYPWVEDKIGSSGKTGSGTEQIDRLARVRVRLAVQATSSVGGEGAKDNATESVTFFKPSEYRGIKDKEVRKVIQETFPKGMEVWHAGGQLAMVRNCRMADHVKIIHAYPGDGQNRESIGTNYLPLQKVLNANFALIDRYFRAAVPRRFALEPYIDTQLLNSQSNDPSKVTAVYGLEDKNLRIPDITGVENTPSPNGSIFQFIDWIISGGPEAMDGGTAAAFGEAETGSDQGVFKTTRLKRDQALQVFAMPWNALCEAVECISTQALQSAAQNRQTDISASLPGNTKMKVELGKIQGSVLIQRTSDEIPQTLAEEEEQMAELVAASVNIELYKSIMNDPANLEVFQRMPSMRDLTLPGADHVEVQQGEFEILLRSGPIPNPQMQQVEEQLQQAATSSESQTPQGMQALQQLEAAAQQLPPMVSTVPVAQNNSENHAIHAAITLGMMNSPTGRKLKNGNDQQKQIYQNLQLHWEEHVAVLKQLTPPPQVDMKASITIDPTKLPPAAQSKAFQALGLEVSPQELTPEIDTHEVTTEKEGLDANGVPMKQKVSVVGKPLN